MYIHLIKFIIFISLLIVNTACNNNQLSYMMPVKKHLLSNHLHVLKKRRLSSHMTPINQQQDNISTITPNQQAHTLCQETLQDSNNNFKILAGCHHIFYKMDIINHMIYKYKLYAKILFHYQTLKQIQSKLTCPQCNTAIIDDDLLYHPSLAKIILHDSIQYANIDCFYKILEHINDINLIENKHNASLLHTASLFIHDHIPQGKQIYMNMAEALLQKNMDINSKNDQGQTPLHLAAWKLDITMLQFLIDHHANIHAKDNLGCTPLHHAVQGNSIEAVKFLIEHRANINAKDKFGWTPLHYAITHDNINMIKLLIEKGADIEAKACINRRTNAKNIFTPLYFAIYYQKMEALDLLIKHQANVHTKVLFALTPPQFAKICYHIALKKLGPLPSSPTNSSVEHNYTTFVRYLEEHSSDLNKPHSGKQPYAPIQTIPVVPKTEDLDELFLDEPKMEHFPSPLGYNDTI